MNKDILVVVRGGGDIATGIIHRLFSAGYRTLILETDKPTSIRRQVCFSEAVYDGTSTVEELTAVKIDEQAQAEAVLEKGDIPLLVDPKGESIKRLQPDIVVDAIIAKTNLGTSIDMADVVIGVGPGFTAGEDVHYCIETMRGHNLARIIRKGQAMPNTGVPGNIGGFTAERVIHAPGEGIFCAVSGIGDYVEQGAVIARITAGDEYVNVYASISGIIRGIIRDGMYVKSGLKIADIDPRKSELENCFTISDKARSIGGSVLEIVSAYANGKYV